MSRDRDEGDHVSITETDAPTDHAKLRAWVDEVAALTQPDAIHWCDGSAQEYDELCRTLVDFSNAVIGRAAPDGAGHGTDHGAGPDD